MAIDTLVVNAQKDAEGEFFRRYAQSGSCGSMRVITASGKVVAVAERLQTAADFEKLLADFRKLPDDDRKPVVPKLDKLDRAAPLNRLPPGALRIKLWSRGLERDEAGALRSRSWKENWTKERGGDLPAKMEPGYDYLWLTEAEWKALLPAEAVKGWSYPLPKTLVKKLACDPMTHNAFSRNPPMVWKPKHVRDLGVTLIVADATAAEIRLRIEGPVRLDAPLRDARGGDRPRTRDGKSIDKETKLSFDGRMFGHLTYDRKANRFTRFDVAALGDFVGFYCDANAKGEVRSLPLGVAFGLDAGPPVPPGLWHRDDPWWRD